MRKWYQSLYWRIGIGFVLFLAAVLAVQGGVLLYLISRMEVGPGQTPPEVTRLVARDLGDALSANSQLDIAQFLRQEYEGGVPLVAVMKDGRTIATHGVTPPENLVREIRARLNGNPESFGRGRGGRPRPSGVRQPRMAPPEAALARTGGFGGRRIGPAAAVFVDSMPAGVVVALPRSAFRQLAPMLGGVGIALVAVATAAAAFLIFGPVRHRLRSLEVAARQVGSGDLTARAREDGGDEVTTLAHTFNQMASDLQSRAEQLQSADRTRRLLLADVSHELMTPLTGMRGYLETLSLHEQSLDAATRERYLAIIRDETRRVEHIVGDLLDLARLEGGGDSFDVQDVPLEDVFGRVLARHGRVAQDKGVRMTSDIAPGAEIVSGDPLRLEQALQNLAANALRHTPRGGRVALAAALDGGCIVVTVSDTGAGIPTEHLPHVFDRFYKVDPARSPSGGRPPAESTGDSAAGSGLGLSIVKAIVERHGGSITASSAAGEGTVFTIKFPAERPIHA